jgi:hypothetical protein
MVPTHVVEEYFAEVDTNRDGKESNVSLYGDMGD